MRKIFLPLAVAMAVIACSLISPGSQSEPGQVSQAAPSTSWATETFLPLVTKTLVNRWQPSVRATWQIVLSGPLEDASAQAEVYDIDLFENEAGVVDALQAQGRKVICYLSAGSWEDWRPDADQFPAEVIGADYEGWAGEKWLDIRRIDLLGTLLEARLDMCAAKGFDGVDPDNVDGYTNDTGFPLTAQDQITFNTWLAQAAHARGLAVGLKNDPEQAPDLLSEFDWILTEDCFDQGWCEQAAVFAQSGKPVFAIEYTDTGIALEDFCPQAGTLNINAILKHRELDAWIDTCP